MLKIYGSHLSVFSNKVRFVAHVCQLSYEYIKVNMREKEHRQADFLKMNPVGKVPVIDDDGFVLFESNAIIRYLAEKTQSSLFPRDLKARARMDQWLEFVSHHVATAINKIVYNRIFAPRMKVPVDEGSIKEGEALLDRFLPVLDQQLAQNKYLSGEHISLADVALLSILDPIDLAGIDILKYAHIVNFRNSLKAEEFYKKSFESGEYGRP